MFEMYKANELGRINKVAMQFWQAHSYCDY